MAWYPKNGRKIRVGEDSIMSLEDNYKLSDALLNELHGNNIYFLSQVQANHLDIADGVRWKTTSCLHLNAHFEAEWNTYIKALRVCGFSLLGRKDKLLWSWNTLNGTLSANLTYEAIIFELYNVSKNWWYRHLWKWKLPLKVKLFCWLSLENRVLICDNYMKRGCQGPNICHMCCSDVEPIFHLMIKCPFSKAVWRELQRVYNLFFTWDGPDLNS